MSNKHPAMLSLDVPARQRGLQIEQIAGATAISGALATPQGAAVGRWLAAFGIAAGLAAVAFFGTGFFLLFTYTPDEMLATRSETVMATAVIPPMQTNAEATRETPQTETIPEVTPSMQTNAEATRETPQTETIPEATPSMQRVITRQGANVRDAPTSSTVVRHASRRLGRRNDLPRATVLRTVPRGTVLQVFARRDGWIQVGQDVPMGWVYSSLLTDAP